MTPKEKIKEMEKEIRKLKIKLVNKEIPRRPYKNQKKRDMELANAYHKGLIDGRKEQKENEINSLLKSGKIDALDRFIGWRQDDVKRVLLKQKEDVRVLIEKFDFDKYDSTGSYENMKLLKREILEEIGEWMNLYKY